MLSPMTGSDQKADLRRYLQAAREALLWKLEGLSEYDVRRPMVATGRKPARPESATALPLHGQSAGSVAMVGFVSRPT